MEELFLLSPTASYIYLPRWIATFFWVIGILYVCTIVIGILCAFYFCNRNHLYCSLCYRNPLFISLILSGISGLEVTARSGAI